MSFIPVRADVTHALSAEVTGGTPVSIAAWVFAPKNLNTRGEKLAVIALLNGGSYDKRYFHVEVPGRSGYSMAEHLMDLGNIIILLDHLGIGESSRASNPKLVTRQVAAAANHAALLNIYERLHSGTLDASLPPIRDFLKVGGGHSMGGMQTITQQAEHQTYDRILVLGYTAAGVHLTVNGRLVSGDRGTPDPNGPDYHEVDRAMVRRTFHWEDVPDDVLAVDDALAVEVPYVMSIQAVRAGIVTEDAGRLQVPVYICLGERDVSPDPHAEPSYYKDSRDVTLHILPRSGHCQNFATTRLQMFDRIHRWIKSIPA